MSREGWHVFLWGVMAEQAIGQIRKTAQMQPKKTWNRTWNARRRKRGAKKLNRWVQTHILPVSQFHPSPGRGKTGPTHTSRTRRQSCSRQARAEPDSEDAHSGRAGMIPPWLTPSVVAEGQSECICSVPRSFLSLWNSWLTSLSSSTLSASVNMMKSSGKLPDSPVTLNSSRPKSCSAEKVSFAYLLNNSVWVKPGAVWSWCWKCQVCGPPRS